MSNISATKMSDISAEERLTVAQSARVVTAKGRSSWTLIVGAGLAIVLISAALGRATFSDGAWDPQFTTGASFVAP